MAIQDFFNQPGTLKSRTGYDQYGKEVQTAGVSVSCRFQNKQRTVLNPDGSVETFDAYAFFDSSVNINAGDHFNFGGIDYRVFDVNGVSDGKGLAHHNEVNLQKWQT